MENLLLNKERKIFPVNPNRDKVFGIKCYANVAHVSEQIDLAIIVTPAGIVPETVKDCGKAGVEGIIIISAGFRDRQRRQRIRMPDK